MKSMMKKKSGKQLPEKAITVTPKKRMVRYLKDAG
jgi:hypothetical protein